jgi:hypothetical protein
MNEDKDLQEEEWLSLWRAISPWKWRRTGTFLGSFFFYIDAIKQQRS